MDKAFDAILQIEVDALAISKSSYKGYGNKFRYQCLCCGEEVYLAAADSHERIPHFKHKKGNNDTECERYLGQKGAIARYVSLRKHCQEPVNFYFNKEKMTFELGVSFTYEELEKYEAEKRHMTVSSKYNSTPFIIVPLNGTVFIPDEKQYFTLTEISSVYYISFNSGKDSYTYTDVMRNPEKINIFRVRKQDNHYRQQISDYIYTDTEYIAISEDKRIIQELLLLEQVTVNDCVFSFSTDGKFFYGLQFSIKKVEYSINYFFQKNDYQVKSSECFRIVWPLGYYRNACFITAADQVYVYCSFDLIPFGNINADASSVKKIGNRTWKIDIKDEIHIHEKNVDTIIQKLVEQRIESDPESPEIIYSNKYTIPDQYQFFLFDKNGCSELVTGTIVYLSETDRIVGYKQGHIKTIVYAKQKEEPDTKQIIADALKYHPQSEEFIADEFMDDITNEIVLTYLEKCYRSGQINTVIKRYIKEGLL